MKISIHALREEGDVSPYRGDQQHAISIHALREEGDVMEMQPAFWQLLFLSTPSARRATCGAGATLLAFLFLSTPSARRATENQNGCGCS